jgi:hypothetical protein
MTTRHPRTVRTGELVQALLVIIGLVVLAILARLPTG